MLRKKQKPLRTAMQCAKELYDRGSVDEALAGVIEARKHVPPDGSGLASDEAAALAEGWEFQAAEEMYKGRLEAGLQALLVAEQVLEGRPEHNELLGRICFRIGSQLAAAPDLRPMQEQYLAKARDLLTGLEEYRELLEYIPDESGDEEEPWQVRRSRLLNEARSLAEKYDGQFEGWSRQEVNRLFRVSVQAMYIGIEEGDDEAARQGFVEAAQLVLTFCSDDSGPFFNYASVFTHIIDRPHFGLAEELSQVAQTAMRLAESNGGADHLSEAYLLAALYDREIRRSAIVLEERQCECVVRAATSGKRFPVRHNAQQYQAPAG